MVNNRATRLAHQTMTGPFEKQVERSPDAVALVTEDGATVSYRQLDERSSRLAGLLRGEGAGPGARIGICIERSVDLIVAIYAAVKTGATYVPLDADLPDARMAYLLSDAAPVLVLTDQEGSRRIPVGPWRVVDLVSYRDGWRSGPGVEPAAATPINPLLHILYTSGTTGRPKGVAYPTDAALAHLDWMQRRYPFMPGDRALFKTSSGFDVSIWEIFWPLYHGASLLICRPGAHRDPRHLAHLVETSAVSTIFLPPTVMTPFLNAVSAARASALRWALCGGEPVTARIRDTFYARLPHATLVNCYGPTEAGNVTDMAVAPDRDASTVPLGRPAEHFRVTLLDENLHPVPIGVAAEAYIGGDIGLAEAYWRAPARTGQRFVADPYASPGSRMYRTGDLCRYRPDGLLEHLGRIDRQIKIGGMRVEPAEIEVVLTGHPDVADCAVVAHGSPTRLVAFVVVHDRSDATRPDLTGLTAWAASMLPVHMRPDQIVAVGQIPATVNGKIDTTALMESALAQAEQRPEPEPEQDSRRQMVAPADDIEAALVEIYGRLLGGVPVSVLDTFVGLGGDSVLAFTLLDECTTRLAIAPEVALLLLGTIRDVADSIRAGDPV